MVTGDLAVAGLNIAVLDYGIGNLRSAQKSLERVGVEAVLTADPEIISAADAAVLPGVGNFGACMDALDALALSNAARTFASSGRPFLGICVGMQLLYEGSDETPGRPGLGLLPGRITLLPAGVKRPQMQWNRLETEHIPGAPTHPLLVGLHGSWMYFVHSYAAGPGPDVIGTANYGGPVTAVVARENIWATQFHPEKSADAGRKLLENWVQWVAATKKEPDKQSFTERRPVQQERSA
jgi:glutamine amidotransferase